MRFLGTIEAKIDSKGRAFLPAQFRKELQGGGEAGLVMRKDIFQPCLCYILKAYGEADRRAALAPEPLGLLAPKHLPPVVAEAEAVTLDANGRMLIPKRLLKAAGISQSVKFIGWTTPWKYGATGLTAAPSWRRRTSARQYRR